MRLFELAVNEFRFLGIEMRRYWFESIIAYSFIFILFLSIFYGIDLVRGDDQQESKDSIVLMFMLWVICWGAYNSVGNRISECTNRGYLSQLFVAGKSFIYLSFARIIAELIVHVLSFLVLLYLAMAITGNWIHINFITFFCIIFLGLPSIFGLGFIFAGVSLLFKKAESLTIVMMMSMIGIVAVEAPLGTIYSLLPLSTAVTTIKSTTLGSEMLTLSDLLFIGINSAIYLIVGVLSFRFCSGLARNRNIIGTY